MPRIPRVPTRANRLANAIVGFEKAQRELAEVKLTGIPKPLAAQIKAAREAAKTGRECAVEALRQERPTLLHLTQSA